MKKDKFFLVLTFISMIISSSFTAYATTNFLFNSSDVKYDNNKSGLMSADVQGALDELYMHATDYTTIDARVTNLENNFLDKTYPIGSIYISVSDDSIEKVKNRFGGNWEKFGEGKTLVSANSTYPINTTGGTESESYTPQGKNTGGAVKSYALTAAQMPSHGHTVRIWINAGTLGNAKTYTNNGTTLVDATNGLWWDSNNKYVSSWQTSTFKVAQNGKGDQSGITDKSGGGQGHTHDFTQPTFTGTTATISHIQPYITVYMYKRIS